MQYFKFFKNFNTEDLSPSHLSTKPRVQKNEMWWMAMVVSEKARADGVRFWHRQVSWQVDCAREIYGVKKRVWWVSWWSSSRMCTVIINSCHTCQSTDAPNHTYSKMMLSFFFLLLDFKLVCNIHVQRYEVVRITHHPTHNPHLKIYPKGLHK